MDNQRLLIWAFVAIMAWMAWQTWQQDYGPQPVQPATEPAGDAAPEMSAPDEDLPVIAAPDDALPAAPDAAPTSTAATPTAPTITVSTDVLDVTISTAGGTLRGAVLKRYPVAKDRPDDLVDLLERDGKGFGLIESGVRAAGGAAEATHLSSFVATRTSFDLGSADELIVPLTWTDESGITIEKRYHFKRGSYRIDLEQVVSNNSDATWKGAEYVRIKRHSGEMERSMFDVDSYSFIGPITYDGEKSEKLNHDDLIDDGPVEFSATQGWVGSIQHHFVRAVVPTSGVEFKYNVSARGNVSTTTAIRRGLVSVEPGSSETLTTALFVGPKLQGQLEEINEKLKLTVDYGWLTIISGPLFWLLSLVYSYVGNWGVAIIVVTFLIKLAFYKLTQSSGRSMAKMRQIQPRMKALQDRYKDCLLYTSDAADE